MADRTVLVVGSDGRATPLASGDRGVDAGGMGGACPGHSVW